MAFLDTGVGGRVGKQPSAPTQPNYWLGDTYSGSTVPTGSAAAVSAQGALENPGLPESREALRDVYNQYPGFGNTLVGLLGGGRPQYSVDDDPSVALARALEQQGIGQLDAWLKAAREREIIQSGDPALAGMAGFGLDPQAGVFAQQNYLSGNADLARVARAKERARKQIVDRLAARGILSSGELGYQEGQTNMDYGNQEYDVRQKVLNRLAEMFQQYLSQKQQYKMGTVTAMQNALNSNNYYNNSNSSAGVLRRYFDGA